MRKLSREEWIAGALHALSSGGIDALRVEPLASELGVTKGSFYHHFENRRELHLAMLAEWERLGTEQVIEAVDESAVEPRERLAQLAKRAFAVDPMVDGIEIGIRAWAATDPTVAQAAERVDARRIEYVVGLLGELGFTKSVATRRARLLYRMMIGESTWRTAGGPASTPKEIRDVVDLFLSYD